MNLKLVLLSITFLAFLACNNNAGSDEAEIVQDEIKALPDDHTSQSSLDYAGTYKGTLPCADCEGIEVELTIDMDSTYALNSKYLGKGDDKGNTKQGTYKWIDGGTIELEDLDTGAGPTKYKVGEGQIWQLDLQGNKVEGSLADKYILKKL